MTFISAYTKTTTAFLTTRSAVDKLMVAEMANTFATRLGPGPYSQLVSELQHRHHAQVELTLAAKRKTDAKIMENVGKIRDENQPTTDQIKD